MMMRLLLKLSVLGAAVLAWIVIVVGPQSKGNTGRTPEDREAKDRKPSAMGQTRQQATASCPLPRIQCPMSKCVKTSGYSLARTHPLTGEVRPHHGIDLRAFRGQRIRAVAHGVIERVSRDFVGYGLFVVVAHDNGTKILVAHLTKAPLKPGTRVTPGDVIGYAGRSGSATNYHAHLEYWAPSGHRVDPEPCLIQNDPADNRLLVDTQR